ncbi:MAG TPA: polysaccharide biosynthesis tyrosine autokinase [Steroidobacteraceae bacterium]|nr:polysaccharide biosynthesis tyrosine autokinase [Steroidobacteraceae bacterium]
MEDGVEIRDVARALRRFWLFLLASLLIGGALGGLYASGQVPTFVATSSVFVSTTSASTALDLNQGSTFTTQIVKSYAAVARSPIVLSAVISNLRLKSTPQKLADSVSSDAPADTSVINISVSDVSSIRSAQIANAVASGLSRAVDALSPSSTNGASIKITVISPAFAPTAPVSPRYTLDVVLGAIAGLVLGILMTAVALMLDNRVRTARDLSLLTQQPVLGEIAVSKFLSQSPLFFQSEPTSFNAEAVRAIRTNLKYVMVGKDRISVSVTSAVAGEGKTTTATNLALALADAGATVLLVDADLRRPKVAEVFGLDGGVGLTDVLVGSIEFGSAVQKGMLGSLDVLPSGPVPPNPAELLGSVPMRDFMDAVSGLYEYVVLDSPPLLPVTDGAVIGRVVDGSIFVASYSKVTRHQVQAATAVLNQAGAHFIGAVFSMVRMHSNAGYGYNYGYGYGQRYSKASASSDV